MAQVTFPEAARVVTVGAGITGASLAYQARPLTDPRVVLVGREPILDGDAVASAAWRATVGERFACGYLSPDLAHEAVATRR